MTGPQARRLERLNFLAVKRPDRPFPWLALMLILLSLGAFWGGPLLMPTTQVEPTFEGPVK